MKHSLLLLLGVAFSLPAHAQTWQDVQRKNSGQSAQIQALSMQVPVHAKSRLLHINTSDLRAKLNQAPVEFLTTSNTTISLPLPDGKLATYTLYNSPIMAKELALQNPDIQTFRIIDAQNPANTGRLDISASGFHAMFTQNGKTVFIDPVGTDGQYQSYFKSDYLAEMDGKNHSPINCMIHGRDHAEQKTNIPQVADVSFGVNLRTYRLAVAGTGEFTAFHGGTKASSLAAMVTGINRVNQVFETDLAVKLEIVPNNSDVIYTNANTDPYTDNDAVTLIGEVVTDLNAKIGIANYDIGHVFSTGGGGLAGLGVVCSANKAEGVTGSQNPINDPFFIDFVAHEFGHQYGANHTFNGTAGACGGGNRSQMAAYEPGGGSTIMAYAGICADENIQNQGTDHYHNHSLGEISEFIANNALGGSCGISTPLNNAVPVPNAGADANIPALTPFILTGSATDANAGDTLSYIWEQYDRGASTSSKATFTDDGTRPLFRSFSPSSSPSRIFPQINDVLSGTTTYGEILPTANRDLNMRFTVRDGKGGVASDTVTLTVSNAAGPFAVTAPGSVTWSANSNQTVTWNVANTTAAPISCANVEIALSTDGGQTFAAPFVASTNNDGTESVSVPNSVTTTGRIRVKCVSQPFFDINSANITIIAAGAGGNVNPVANNDSFTVDQDSVATSFDVLGNDTDADGDTLNIASISNISDGGTATINGTNIDYTPANGFSGTETFTYAISDSNGGTSSATVTVTVTPANNAPIANDDSFTVAQNSGSTLFAVLANDTDPDNDTLSISSIGNISNGGTVIISGTNISYRPANGFSGTETFTYVARDDRGSINGATVTITVTATSTGGGGGGGNTGGGSSSGGGGSFGLFLLFLLGLGGLVKNKRSRQQLAQTVPHNKWSV